MQVMFLSLVKQREGWVEENGKKETMNKLKIPLALTITINNTSISISFFIQCGLINIYMDFL